jgi:penicillin amidase
MTSTERRQDTLHASVGAAVEIIRDGAGVPHIYAQSTPDVYFGLGFAMAQDRLWQMDRLRRRALGRQAEILGPDYVQSDLLHRAVGISQTAEREVERTDPATRHILDRFVAGINRYIETSERDLPIEFSLLEYVPQPFTVRDSIAILRGEWWSLNGRLHTLAIGEAARLLPERLRAAYLAPEAAEHRILPPGAVSPTLESPNDGAMGMSDGSGSNNWALAGSRTASGQALLCSDPHQPFWVPSSWYEYAVHGPEDDAAGAGHPGVPGLLFGANGNIAWGITNNATSTRDLSREQVHPTDPHLYKDGDTWRAFDEHIEEIHVRGQASVRHFQRTTVRGPIVNHVVPVVEPADDAPLSLRWVGQEHLDDVRALVAVGRATDWDTFRTALRDWSVPIFNFGYADKTGRVGYQCAGRVPLRGRVARGYREANEPDDVWQGYVPFDALPQVVDPVNGYIASANERVAPDDYPYALHGSFGAGHRAARIHQALADKHDQTIDRDQAIALQNDVKSCRAERLCPPLVQWLAGADHPDVLRLRETFVGWDYRYTIDSQAPTLFETFMEVWQDRVARERFPDRLVELVKNAGGVAALIIERGDADLKWFDGDLREELVQVALETVERVRTVHGADARWGTVHQAHWRHPLSATGHPDLDVGPAAVDGGPDTLRNTGAGQPAFAAAGGAEYRLIVDFAEPDRFLAVQNVGNSGRPGSPHYADQFQAWLDGSYHVVSLRRADVEAAAEHTTILQPDG